MIKLPDGSIDRSKTFCGAVCNTHFQLRADPQKMRLHVFFRDKGICQHCDLKHKYLDDPWEADHIRPLMMALGDPTFWEPENVTLLCFKCHKIKTAGDRRRYRKAFRRKFQRIFEEISED